MSSVKISKPDLYGPTSFVLDGVEVNRLIQSATVQIGYELARITVVLASSPFAFDGDAEVRLTDEQAELLLMLGWTAPREVSE